MPEVSSQPARIVLAADPFDQTLDFFTDRLGFRIDVISPADDPDRATLSYGGSYGGSGNRSLSGLVIVLDRFGDKAHGAGLLEVAVGDIGLTDTELIGTTIKAPNGTLVRFVADTTTKAIPDLQPNLVVSTNADTSSWVTGRAGMRYRDLIPDRQGGRFIASHIKVPGSGPVPDWVHHHDIQFQIIFCRSGAATLVYEDQGDPFRFEAGDCILQPPGIRHRVLETFDDMEVVELGCPARHDTFADHHMELPTGRHLPNRDYNGQRFVHFKAASASPATKSSSNGSGNAAGPWASAGWQVTDTGIDDATGGVGSVRMVVATGPTSTALTVPGGHDDDLLFLYVLDGAVELTVGDTTHRLRPDDSAVVPPGVDWSLADRSTGAATTRILEVTSVESKP